MDTATSVQDKIEQLLFITKSFLKLSEDLSDFYINHRSVFTKSHKILNSHELKSLSIQQKLYFSEVLLFLRTIFEKPKSPQEVSYESLFREISKATKYHSEYTLIRNQYMKSGLKDLTDQLI